MQRRTPKNKKIVAAEVTLGRYLYETRGKRSEVSGRPLGLEYDHVYASHVLAKLPYPKFRLYHKNIVLMTFAEHQLWEFSHHKIKDKPEWQWVFKLQELLRQEYYKSGRNKIDYFSIFIDKKLP